MKTFSTGPHPIPLVPFLRSDRSLTTPQDIPSQSRVDLAPAWWVVKLSLSRRPLGPSPETCHLIQTISEHQTQELSPALPRIKHYFCLLSDLCSIRIRVESFYSSMPDTASIHLSHRSGPVNWNLKEESCKPMRCVCRSHRLQIFLTTPELAALHRELVMGGHITESEFWEGREVCSVTAAAHDTR